MPQTKLDVKLLEVTQGAMAIIYAACRQCYSENFAGDIFKAGLAEPEKAEDFIRRVVATGHESPLEHVKFTFAIQGVSRAATHQLVRHRLASYSQQSQRYVKESQFDYIIPPSIEKDSRMKELFISTMGLIQENYNKLQQFYKEGGQKGEAANQDARFLLPQATETKIVVTMNCRELLHFFKHRCCTRAQWEIRALANEMLSIARRELPEVFNNAGAQCESLGFCPEGERFTCGKYPAKEKAVEGVLKVPNCHPE